MKLINLIATNSFYLMNEEIKKITKEQSYTTFDMNNTSLEEILEEAAYFSLFDEKKYLVIKNANIFGTAKNKQTSEEKKSKKDDLLLKYFNQPNPNTILIFTIYGKCDSKKKIVKEIKEKYNLIQIDDLPYKEIQKRIEKELKDYKIDYNIPYYIYNNCQNNYDLIVNELEKIKLYYSKGNTITINDIENIISRNLEDNNFRFIDAIMGKKIKDAFKIYDDLITQKVQPIMLFIMLSKEIRNTLLVIKLRDKNSKKDIMKQLNINYDFQIDKIINNSYTFKEKELEEYLVKICELDYKIKKGKINSKLALEMLILEICK